MAPRASAKTRVSVRTLALRCGLLCKVGRRKATLRSGAVMKACGAYMLPPAVNGTHISFRAPLSLYWTHCGKLLCLSLGFPVGFGPPCSAALHSHAMPLGQ